MISACHRYGWPVAAAARGRSPTRWRPSIAEHGGRIETGRPVRSLAELPAADAVVLDLAPAAVAEIAGDRLPRRVARAYRRYRHGPAPSRSTSRSRAACPGPTPARGRAGTVHAIGSFEEVAAAEREVNRGRMPERPFVLVGQQYLADPSRSRGDVHPVWAYAHVPTATTGDATEAILDQIERFAPGLRERIVGRRRRARPTELEAYNPNYVGGDIMAGANTPLQTLVRPAAGARPLRDRRPRRLHLLGGDAPGAGGARDVRLRRRPVGAAPARAQLPGRRAAAASGRGGSAAPRRRPGRRRSPAGSRPSGLSRAGRRRRQRRRRSAPRWRPGPSGRSSRSRRRAEARWPPRTGRGRRRGRSAGPRGEQGERDVARPR